MSQWLAILLMSVPLSGAATHEVLVEQVKATEREFAASMANRDLDAFKTFLDDEAIFISGESTLTGKEAIEHTWSAYFSEPDAPFSWDPDQVEVLESGNIALSTGPVLGPDGAQIAVFTSVWRLNEDGHWRVILDKGNRYCE